LTSDDRLGSAPVVVVDELLARRAWPGESALESALGQELRINVWREGQGFVDVWARVVGVVQHVRHHDLAREVREEVFVPLYQSPRHQLAVVVKSALAPESLSSALRAELRAIDPRLAVTEVRTLESYLAGSTRERRAAAAVTSTFAALALLLTVLGVYGLVSYLVGRRGREIGLRLALGARARNVVGLVFAGALPPLGAGLLAGVAATAAVTRPLRALLFEVGTADPWSFALAPLVVALVAIAACALPALRAVRIDPARALRSE
jgi:hypothetical protein